MRRVLASILLSSFATPFTMSSLSLALSAMARDFGIPSPRAIWVLTLFTLVVAALVLPMGRLSDIWGHVRLFRLGLALGATGFVLGALSPRLEFLLASVAVAASGLAAVFGSNNALIFELVPRERRSTAVGLNSAFVYIGLTAGPAVGGLLASINWRLVLLPPVAVLFTSLMLSWGFSSRQRGGKLDYPGAFLLATALALITLGVSVGVPTVLLAGLAALVAAVFVEGVVRDPLVDLSLFRNFVFAASVFAAFLNYLSTAALTPALSVLLQEVYHSSSRDAGLILSAQAASMAALAPVAGRLGDRIPPSFLAAAGASVVAISLLLFSPGALLPLLVVIGAGFAFFVVPNTTLILSSAPPERRGVASAMVAEARVAGQSLSNAIATYALSGGVAAGFRSLLITLALFAALSAALSLARLSRR